MKPGLFLLALKTMVVADQIAWNKYMNTLRLHDAGRSGDGNVAQLDQRYLANVKSHVNRATLRKLYGTDVKRVERNSKKWNSKKEFKKVTMEFKKWNSKKSQHHHRTKESRGKKKHKHYFSLVF